MTTTNCSIAHLLLAPLCGGLLFAACAGTEDAHTTTESAPLILATTAAAPSTSAGASLGSGAVASLPAASPSQTAVVGTGSDNELALLLANQVSGLAVDVAAARAHVIEPQNVVGISSDHGGEGAAPLIAVGRGIIGVTRPYYLDVRAFQQALRTALTATVSGYTVRLRQNGLTVFTDDWGWAKTQQDGAEGWTPDVSLHVGSVSKLITAMDMTLLLSEMGISPDAPIIDYMPDYWVKGPITQFVTFRNLLNHTSGLYYPNDHQGFQIMKQAVANGITLDASAPDHLGNYHYQNMNYGLCRILLSVINGNISRGAWFPLFDDDQIWDYVTINAYASYTQRNVFRPAGVSGASLDHGDATGLAYRFPVDSTSWNSGNLESMSAFAGWHLSADQVLDVMSEFRRGRGILAPEQAQAMLDSGFGVDPLGATGPTQPALHTPAGDVYCKNGTWDDGQGHEEQALAYFLPQGMELVLLANSPVGDGVPHWNFRNLVTQIYVQSLTTQLASQP